MMRNKIEKSEAMKRVWDWKNKIYEEVKELGIDDKFKKIHKMAKETEESLLIKK